MYESHWELTEPPFSSTLESRHFYASPMHEEALARLQFLVTGPRQLGVLLGDWGSGKSLLLEVFAEELHRRGSRVAKFSALGMDAGEFLWQTAAQWGLNPDATWSQRQLWTAIADKLAEFRYERLRAVLLVDDADEAAADVLVQLARLAQWEATCDARMTITLAARTERLTKIGRRLLELTDLRIEIGAWSLADTQRYIEQALAKAGRLLPAFEQSAYERLHQLSHGMPRRVQQLAELSLVAGAGSKLSLIDAQTVDTVFQELAVPVSSRRMSASTT
jgi:general secretion pathway protein A